MRENDIIDWKTILQLVVVGLLLLSSWVVVFGWLDLWFGDGPLVPYASAALLSWERPPINTWQRQLNDYFAWPPFIARRVAFLFVGLSVALFSLTWFRISKSAESGIRLGLDFALSNVVFVLIMFVSQSWFNLLPDLALLDPPGYRAGYGSTYKYILAGSLWLLLWLVLQARVIPRWLLARFSPAREPLVVSSAVEDSNQIN